MNLKEALSFFSRMPAGDMTFPKDLKGAFLWFPCIGLVIGVIVAFVMGLANVFLPSLFIGIVGCFVWLLLTKGANIQGVAECGDTLFDASFVKASCCTAQKPEEKLVAKKPEAQAEEMELPVTGGVTEEVTEDVTEEVTEDVTEEVTKQEGIVQEKSSCTHKKHGHAHKQVVGVFGFAAIFFVLAFKTVALTLLSMHYDIATNYQDFMHLMFICIAAAMFARCVSFFAMLMPVAKEEGFAYEFAKPLFDFHYAVIGVLAFVICYFSGVKSLFMILMCAIFTVYILLASKKRFGGLTEAVVKSITEVSECLVLMAFCLQF